MLAVDQDVVHQQFFDVRLQTSRQLREEHAEVSQYLIACQRLARSLRLNAAAIDDEEMAIMSQQIV